MKKIGLLLFALIFIVISFVIILWTSTQKNSFDQKLRSALDQQIENAVEQMKPTSEVDLGDFYRLPMEISLLAPPVGSLLSTKSVDLLKTLSTAKCGDQRVVWSRGKKDIRFGCDLTVFEERLLSEPPFMHETGLSYALLLVKIRPKLLEKPDWVIENLHYFHISEISALFEQIMINRIRISERDSRFITKFSALSRWGAGVLGTQQIIGSSDISVIFRDSQNPYMFKFYDTKEFLDRITIPGIKAAANHCDFKYKSLCWQFDDSFQLNRVNRRLLGFASLLFVLLIGIALWLFFYLKQEYEVARSRKLSLEILSHELRTPVSALLLQFENMASRDGDDDIKHYIPLMSQNIFRLQRLVEDTKNYINVEKNISRQKIESLRDFLHELAEQISPDIQIEMESDYRVEVNFFWLSLCLKNLLKNAVQHGKAPYKVSVIRSERSLGFMVADAGLEFSQDIKGLGLGLGIVRSAAEKLGAEITIEKQPTRIQLMLKGVSCQQLP